MPYAERPTLVPGVVLWQSRSGVGTTTRILPDGCMDLIWDGRDLVVAGPDTAARLHSSAAGAAYTALRFAGGSGPALLGVPADTVRDQSVDLGALWPQRRVADLCRRLDNDNDNDNVAGAGHPGTAGVALAGWLASRAARTEIDPFGARVLYLTRRGSDVDAIAALLSMGARQVHRRCLTTFGYGPKMLARVVRLERAVAAGRSGQPWASVAARCGYADQAHLARELRALAGASPTALLRRPGVPQPAR